jgi:hypothetical protein
MYMSAYNCSMKTQVLTNKNNLGLAIALFAILLISYTTAGYGQTLYVSAAKGNDHATGTNANPLKTLDEAVLQANKFSGNEPVKIMLTGGLYTVTHKLAIYTKANSAKASFTLEALTLPDDKAWQPADLPVIVSISSNNSDYEFPHCEGLLIEQNNVTIKGLKFLGNPNNAVRNYYPIRRQNKMLSGLNVSQCYFIGEANSAPIQSSFWASGPGIHVDHCIFHNSKIAFVLGDGVNDFSLTHSIIDGAYNTAIWYGFAGTTPKFNFKDNVITNCYYVMVYPVENGQPAYTFSDSFITNNAHYLGNYPKAQDKFIPETNLHIKEINVNKSGAIKLVNVADDGITKDNLNLAPTSAAKNTRAGIFSK